MKNTHPLSLLPLSAVSLCLVSTAFGQAVVMSGAGNYTQDFNTLPASGAAAAWSDNTTLANWYAVRGAAGTLNITANSGGSTGGQLYAYGVGTDAERALGSIASGTSGLVSYGVLLHNTSGSALTINSLAYTGEQWRNGGNATAHKLTASYKKDSAPIAGDSSAELPAGWTALNTADFTGPIATATPATLVGNDTANKVAISSNPGITVANGEYVMIRWADPNDTGNDHGLAIDDLTIGWVVESLPSLSLSIAPNSFDENAGASAAVATLSIPAALGSDLTVTLASSDTTEATVPLTKVIPAGSTSVTFPVSAVDDFLVEASGQAVTISATAPGYTQGQFGITVNDADDSPIGILVTPDTFSEAAGAAAATGTVELAQNTLVDLVVNLTSLDTSEATVPATVTILANTDSITFPVNAVNDTDPDGNRTVTIRANATGYTQGQTTITVQDDGDVPPPPTLAAGDIAFVGYNADGNDDFAIVALTALDSSDVILFSDNEWNGQTVGSGGAFNDQNEGVITWTPPAEGVPVGTVVTFNNLSLGTRSVSLGSITTSGSFALATGVDGDSIYAFQGAALIPTGFVSAFSANADSVVGTGLSASHHVVLTAGLDIAAYNAARDTQASYPGYLTLISNPTNWVSQDTGADNSADGTAPDLPFSTTAFTLGSGGSNYGTWAAANGATGGIDGDTDHDGIVNLLEYALGLDPDTDDSNPVGTLVNGLVSFTKGAEAVANGDVSYKIQTSSTLASGSWVDATPTSNTPTQITYQLPAPSPTVQKVFARLVVTQNP